MADSDISDDSIAHLGGGEYLITETTEDTITRAIVTLRSVDDSGNKGPECSMCQNVTPGTDEICLHVTAAVERAPAQRSREEIHAATMENAQSKLLSLGDRMIEHSQRLAAQAQPPAEEGRRALQNDSGTVADTDDDEPEETDTSVSTDHAYDEDACENAVLDWYNDKLCVAVPGLKDGAVEAEFAEYEGDLGVRFEAGAPWDHGGWDNDSNSPTDDWKEFQQTLSEQMKSRDEVQYQGDPDYFNFLAVDDFEAVIGEEAPEA